MGVFSLMYKHNLTKKQISNTLRVILVIKEKRDGTLKGRTCADRYKQQDWYSKYKTTLHIVHTDSFIMITVIEAKEYRDVATANIKGAYLYAHQKDFTVIKFVAEQVDIMCEIDPEYEKYVTYEGKNKVLYLSLLHALYGTLTAALF